MRLLGTGKYESAIEGETPPSVRDTRDYFLAVVKRLAPEVLEDLSGEPLRHYSATRLHFDVHTHKEHLKDLNKYDQIRELTRLRSIHDWNYPDWHTHFEGETVTYDECLAAMQKSIFDWSRKWCLDESWCRDRAYKTLDYWCSWPDFHSEKLWNYEPLWETIIAFRRGEHPRFTFEYKTLYPRQGHRSIVTRQITAAFKEQLKAFLDDREQVAKAAGMKPTPTKREESHFEWLVRFQVEKMPYEEIYKLYYPRVYLDIKNRKELSERTKFIRKAVNGVARFINLSLRKDGTTPGRRPANK